MKEITFTKGQIKKLQELIKQHGYLDVDSINGGVYAKIPVGQGCDIVQSFPLEIIDLALEHLAIKAQNTIIYLEPPVEEKPSVDPKDTKQKVLVRVWPLQT